MCSILLCAAEAAVPVEIVINRGVAVERIDASTLRVIFAMRMSRWPDGTPVKVFVLPDDSPLHETFAKTLLNTYPHQLRRNWNRMVFSGTGNAPVEVKDEHEMLEKISTTPGAIGYLGSIEETGDVQVIKPE